jgi:hypothetical protein
LALALVATMATGCLAQPETEPSPAFSSDEEAFAAAEATYRAYVHALNEVDLSDPTTFEGVYAWTTGELSTSDRKGLSAYHADGVAVSGDSRIQIIQRRSIDETGVVTLAVCLDVSEVQVVGEDGGSLVAPDRVRVQSLLVSVAPDEASPTRLLLTSIGAREGEPACV